MKRLLFAIILTLAAIGFAQKTAQLSSGGPAVKELKGKSKGHTYRVVLRAHNAKAAGRKISFSKASDPAIVADHILINGAQTWGFDGIYKEWVPKGHTARQVLEERATEIYGFDVWIDGKRIRIPRRKYETVLQPDLGRAEALFSDDGKLFFVFVSGSDGAGSWSARWTITRASGKVQVQVSGGG